MGLGFALFGLSAIEATALSLWLLTPEMGPSGATNLRRQGRARIRSQQPPSEPLFAAVSDIRSVQPFLKEGTWHSATYD